MKQTCLINAKKDEKGIAGQARNDSSFRMKKYLLIVTSVLLLFVSCRDELDDTIFIPDATDPNLPAYTEWGYNSFGAKYEREYFLSTYERVPCKVIYQEGKLHFSLVGHLGWYTGDYNDTRRTVTFSFPISVMTSYKDLLVLNDTRIDLSDAACEVTIQKDNKNAEPIALLQDSYLYFKRAQLLRVDDVENRVILSGTFEINFLTDGIPEKITDGRFDMGINKDFHSFEN
jgi:hypothetical protein